MPRPSDSDTLKDIIALTKYTMGFVPFTFIDFIDIILVAAIMFWIYRATRGTNAPYIISGIIMIYLMWVVVRTLNMELLNREKNRKKQEREDNRMLKRDLPSRDAVTALREYAPGSDGVIDGQVCRSAGVKLN